MSTEQDAALTFLTTSLTNAGVDTEDIDPKDKPVVVQHVQTQEEIQLQEKEAMRKYSEDVMLEASESQNQVVQDIHDKLEAKKDALEIAGMKY